MHGTSQASPHIAGIAVLAQDLADQFLGRRLTVSEFATLLNDTAVTINDGDDEDDNVTNTNLNFPRVDVFALANAIAALGNPNVHYVTLATGQARANLNFGNQPQCGAWGHQLADLNRDCTVSPVDLTLLAAYWLAPNPAWNRVDINNDGIVDLADFTILAHQFLTCTTPYAPTCINAN